MTPAESHQEDDVPTQATEALWADRSALLDLCAGLCEADWKTESGCPGWSVQDVVAHMGALFTSVVAPGTLPDTAGLATERAQDVHVEFRRSWSAAQVVRDYASVSTQAIGALERLAAVDRQLDLGDLGTHPAALLPNAFAFDHYTHIRADLFAPRGPLTGTPPPSDELRLTAAIDWIEAALPQQNRELLAGLSGSADLVLDGPGGRTIKLGAGGRTLRVAGDTTSFVRWITQRGSWEELDVTAYGDPEQAALLRRLRVW
ncbi:maleylpyruvate isomerase family mycothiol-dependent enzyme [Streptomyces sp. So13.3]|uniref:maleylpyruvate isomerase family mycothiol-dependent enzyme n=1 Tax=Streptomyces TaxID=1883 RepID=UPI0011074CB7|nr:MULTISPECIES: maleylpyruvate isomerase family mycothiol-dependent enzyme [Streptomyces]MCZ4097986.1 maleylpyruvate isomerase family mycothiol-dependent enzyme [Streptomyces sp. H39-C1]QNA71736.1 maleylpyruvate isomerase family mycothiol-dependent enzyme [Streptomyces sp. So13.3]